MAPPTINQLNQLQAIVCPDCGHGNLVDFDAASMAVNSLRNSTSMAKESLAEQYRAQDERTRNWLLVSFGFAFAVFAFTVFDFGGIDASNS
jgi:hypothetical protein